MREIVKIWRTLLRNKTFVMHFILSLMLCVISFYASNKISSIKDTIGGPPLKDLLLDYLPVYQTSALYNMFCLVVWILLIIYHLGSPSKLPYLFFCFAIFFLLRSFFISLTHMGPPEGMSTDQFFSSFNQFKSDLFFSGHTGAPFLLACLSNEKGIKIICILFSILMGISVMLTRLHYSIDVFASFFIVHSLSVLLKSMPERFPGLFISNYQ
jgi:hypothetical protein